MSQQLRALGGTAGMIAGGLLIVFEVGMFAVYAAQGFNDADMAAVAQQPVTIALSLIGVLGACLAVPAFLALYRQQAEESGGLGLLAVGVACLGAMLAASVFWVFAFVEPWVAERAPELLSNDGPGGWLQVGFMTSFFTAGAGFLLLGVSVLRAKVFPAWTGALLAVAGIIAFTPLPAGPGLLVGAALVECGMVVRRLNATAAAAAPAHSAQPAH